MRNNQDQVPITSTRAITGGNADARFLSAGVEYTLVAPIMPANRYALLRLSDLDYKVCTGTGADYPLRVYGRSLVVLSP